MEKSTKKVLIIGGGVIAATAAFMYFSKKASAASGPSGVGPFKLTAAQANSACASTAGPGGDGFVSAIPPPDVQTFLNPNTIGAGSWTAGPVFAYFKGNIWRFSNPMGYAKCANVDASKLSGLGAPRRIGGAINSQLAPLGA